jgi:putative DNA primase/helicase
MPTITNAPATLDDIQSALASIPADDRETWVKIGMALHAELGDNGFGIFNDWSRNAESYRERDTHDVWRSFKPGPVGIATLFHLAQEYGWTRDATSLAPPRPRPVPKPAPQRQIRDTGAYARQLWKRALWDDTVLEHPYAIAKGIEPVEGYLFTAGAKRGIASGKIIGSNADCIIIPFWDLAAFDVVAVQCVNAAGAKQSFGPIGGHAFVIGNTLDPSIPWYVCEGWADAVSLCHHVHDGNAVSMAAGGKGNMERVAFIAADVFHPRGIKIIEDAK